MATISGDKQNKKSLRPVMVVLAVILFFLALCWGIWWFFDYKIRVAQSHYTAITMSSSTKK